MGRKGITLQQDDNALPIAALSCALIGLGVLLMFRIVHAQEAVEGRKHDRKHTEPFEPTPAPPKPHADEFDPMPPTDPVEKRPKHIEPKPDPEFKDVKPDRHPDKHDTRPHDIPPVIHPVHPRTWLWFLVEFILQVGLGVVIGYYGFGALEHYLKRSVM